MTTPRTFTTLALHRAARSCVRALPAFGMGYLMQRSSGGKFGKAGLNFINGPGDPTTRMFAAGAPSA